MIHLVFISSALGSGGSERALSELANHYASMEGYTVSIITLAAPSIQPFYSLCSQIQLIQLDQSQPRLSFANGLWNTVRRVMILRKTIRALQPNIVISFIDIMNLTTLLAMCGLDIPLVVAERTHPAYYQLPPFYNQLRRWLYPKASCVVVQTASVAGYFKGLRNLTIIPNAVRIPACYKKQTALQVRQLISVGRLCPFKGFDMLIQAFAQIVQRYPELTLTIYGEGAHRASLEQLIQQLNLGKRVSLPGAIQQIDEALCQADLFIFPSQYEGFPNALCEAMAVGLPIIASACSGTVDIIRDGQDGRLFPIGDTQALVSLMIELLEDHVQRERLAHHAMEICQRFSRDFIFKAWDDLLQRIQD